MKRKRKLRIMTHRESVRIDYKFYKGIPLTEYESQLIFDKADGFKMTKGGW